MALLFSDRLKRETDLLSWSAGGNRIPPMTGLTPHFRFSYSLQIIRCIEIFPVKPDRHLQHFSCYFFFRLLIAGEIHSFWKNIFFWHMAINAINPQLLINNIHHTFHFFIADFFWKHFQVGVMLPVFRWRGGGNSGNDEYKQ